MADDLENWTIIFNPTAGTFRPHKLEAVRRVLHAKGVSTHLLATDGPGHATELARKVQGTRLVAAFGGDGTLNEVANGLLGRELPLLFLPGGTANVMAYELGISTDPVRAALAGLTSRPRPVCPGQVNGRAFLLMAGFGLDAEAVLRVNSRLKWWTGKAAYIWSGLKAGLHRHPKMRADLNGGGRVEGQWLVVARGAHYGGGFKVHPDAGLLNEQLAMVMVRQLWFVPFLVTHLALNLHHERGGIALRRLSHCRLESERPVPVHVDGDFFTTASEFELGLATETVQLCFPR